MWLEALITNLSVSNLIRAHDLVLININLRGAFDYIISSLIRAPDVNLIISGSDLASDVNYSVSILIWHGMLA